MNVVLVIYEQFSQVCHNLWWNEEVGFYPFSTDEGDRMGDMPIDVAIVSKDDSNNKYAYDPETKSIVLNTTGNPNLLRVDFCTADLPGVPPIGEQTLYDIFRSRILDQYLPKA